MESLLLWQMFCRKVMVRLNSIKNVLLCVHILHFCNNSAVSSGIIVSSWQFFLKKWSPFLKSNAMEKKWERGLTSWKEVLHFSQMYSFFARILFPFSRNIRQIATCKQHFRLILIISRNVPMRIDQCTFLTTILCESHTHVV